MSLHQQISSFVNTFGFRFGQAPERHLVQRVFAAEAPDDVNACLDQFERDGLLSSAERECQASLRRAIALQPKLRIPVRGFSATRPRPARPESAFGSIIMDLGGVGVPVPEETYVFQVPDDSMVGAGLRQGDFAIIASNAGPSSGEIAIVRLKEKLVLRRYVLIARIPHLLAEHPTNPELIPAYEAQFEGVMWAALQIDPSHQRINCPQASRVRYSQQAGSTSAPALPLIPERLRKPPLDYSRARLGAQQAVRPERRPSRSAGDAISLRQHEFLVDPGSGLPLYGVNEILTDSPSKGGYRTRCQKTDSADAGSGRRRKTGVRQTRR
jgi:hypothetical protein